MFENRRRGRQARNFTTNAPKILDLKSSSEQIFSRKLPLGAPDLRPSTDCNGKWTRRNLMKKEKVSSSIEKSMSSYLETKSDEFLVYISESFFLGILIYLDLETDIESSNLWAIFPRYIVVRFMKAYLPAKPWRGLPISGIRFGHFILCPSNDFSFMVSLRTYFKV